MAAPDTNGVEVDRAVGQGEFHGIPVGQSPQRPGLSAPPGVDPAKLRAEPVTLSQTQPSPNRLMDQGEWAWLVGGWRAGAWLPSLAP